MVSDRQGIGKTFLSKLMRTEREKNWMGNYLFIGEQFTSTQINTLLKVRTLFFWFNARWNSLSIDIWFIVVFMNSVHQRLFMKKHFSGKTSWSTNFRFRIMLVSPRDNFEPWGLESIFIRFFSKFQLNWSIKSVQ